MHLLGSMHGHREPLPCWPETLPTLTGLARTAPGMRFLQPPLRLAVDWQGGSKSGRRPSEKLKGMGGMLRGAGATISVVSGAALTPA